MRERHDAETSLRDRTVDYRDAAADRRDYAADARDSAADARELAQDVRDLEQDERERRLAASEATDEHQPATAHLDVLTARQREILAMIADGMSNKAIARQLYITINTVKTTIRALYAKIGVTSRTQAVRWHDHGPRNPGS